MDNFSENEDINIRLNNIFKTKFSIDLFDNRCDTSINDNLLGKKFKLTPRDLIYLLDYVEKEFNITITDYDIDNIKFNTINNILQIIKSKSTAKEIGTDKW